MSGGSVHKHTYNIKMDRVIKREEELNGDQFLRNCTHAVMIITRGYPTYNDTKNTVMLSATNVECVHWENYTFRNLINIKGTYSAEPL